MSSVVVGPFGSGPSVPGLGPVVVVPIPGLTRPTSEGLTRFDPRLRGSGFSESSASSGGESIKASTCRRRSASISGFSSTFFGPVGLGSFGSDSLASSFSSPAGRRWVRCAGRLLLESSSSADFEPSAAFSSESLVFLSLGGFVRRDGFLSPASSLAFGARLGLEALLLLGVLSPGVSLAPGAFLLVFSFPLGGGDCA